MNELRWVRVGSTPRVGPIQFLEDGGFRVLGTDAAFTMNNRLVNCSVGPGLRFDFDHGKACLAQNGVTHYLRFVGQEGWEHALEGCPAHAGGPLEREEWGWLVLVLLVAIPSLFAWLLWG